MSDKDARKRAAREFQARHPGTSYLKALRAVARARRRPAFAVVVGTDAAGRPQRVNLDEQAHGGNGPHMLIAGPQTTETAAALSTVATALVRQEASVRLVVCGSDAIRLDADHERVGPTEASAAIDQLLDQRSAELKSLGCADVHQARMVQPDYPTYVVVIEIGDTIASLERGLRMGRSLGVHFVIGCVAPQAAGAGRRRPDLYVDVPPEILCNIPQGFAVTEQTWSVEWSSALSR